jgi:hypothetical protein
MIRAVAMTLALVAGHATAAEPVDCYNDEAAPDLRYTSMEPEVLRVTDADISDMLTRMREGERQSVASAELAPAMHASLNKQTPASD